MPVALQCERPHVSHPLVAHACMHARLQRPISLNFGMVMTGWYDINSLEAINMEEDEAGLRESMRYVMHSV